MNPVLEFLKHLLRFTVFLARLALFLICLGPILLAAFLALLWFTIVSDDTSTGPPHRNASTPIPWLLAGLLLGQQFNRDPCG